MNCFRKSVVLALLACATSFTFAGCGGGGDSPSPISDDRGSPPPPPYTGFAAAGFWGGPQVTLGWDGPPVLDPDEQLYVVREVERAETYSGIQANFWDTAAADGSHIGLAVLPTGKTWWMIIDGGVIGAAGYGQTQVNGPSSITVKGMLFNSSSAGIKDFTGSVVPRSQFDLTPDDSMPGLGSTRWRTTYDSRYEQPATQAKLVGTYTAVSGAGTYYRLPTTSTTNSSEMVTSSSGNIPAGRASTPPPAALSALGRNYTVTISRTGEVTLPPDPLGCSGSGAAMPRTDSNVYNLSIRFSGAKCVLGNGVAVQGIAVVENGHLLMLATPLEGAYPAGIFAFVSN